MKKDTEQYNRPSRHRRDLWLGVTPAEWFISGIAGITSAIAAASVTIRRRFDEEVKFWPGYNDVMKGYQEDLERINDKFRGKPKLWREHHEIIDKVKESKAFEVHDWLQKEYGILTRGRKFFSWETLKGLTYGTYQRYHWSGTKTGDLVLISGTISAFIGAAMTLSFFNGVASRHKIERIEDAVTLPTEGAPPLKQPESGSRPDSRVNAIHGREKLMAATAEPELPTRG